MPKGDYFSKALYTFHIGQNDLAKGFFFGNMNIETTINSVLTFNLLSNSKPQNIKNKIEMNG